jgi:pimeloyl-ACP methyl ester carboxylesterase
VVASDGRALGGARHAHRCRGVAELRAGGLYANADAVRSVLDGTAGAVVLCGHSYGGMVIADAVEPG